MSSPTDEPDVGGQDHGLALAHGVVFRTLSRPAGWKPDPENGVPFELPRDDGTFTDPAAAIEFARSMADRDVTVMANGSGPYWTSAYPDRISSDLLQTVC